MGMEQRVAVVTGGGRGIGRGVVEALAEMGLRVAVNYRNDAKAAEEVRAMALRLGAPEALSIRADVADVAQGRALVAKVLDHFGRLDVWVNNAGIAPENRVDLLKTTTESWDRVLGTNLRGPFFLTQEVARVMIELVERGIAREPQIQFIGSVSSTTASVGRGEYCVSKAGLSMVAQLFAVRLAPHGVRVYEIRPGLIDTDMTKPVHEHYDRKLGEGLVPLGRWGTPGDVGRASAALAGGALPYATGAVLDVDGGLQLRRL